jgi:hypothetical protein
MMECNMTRAVRPTRDCVSQGDTVARYSLIV